MTLPLSGLLVVALEAEASRRDVEPEVLGHLEAIDDTPDA